MHQDGLLPLFSRFLSGQLHLLLSQTARRGGKGGARGGAKVKTIRVHEGTCCYVISGK